MSTPDLTAAEARRLALAAQGFADPLPSGRVDVRHARRVMSRLGAIQLDSVNAVVRAHYMPMYSRLGPYDRTLLHRVAYDQGEWFEYWAHEASLLPVERYPLFRARMDGLLNGHGPSWWPRYERAVRPYIEPVLDELAERGPLAAGELSEPGERPKEGWGWRYTPGKHALEFLFRIGRVSARRRASFERVYDLVERVIPDRYLRAPVPSLEEAERDLALDAARSLGVATVNDLADYYRAPVRATARRVKHLVRDGRLTEVRVESWDKPGYVSGTPRIPRAVNRPTLLSPFDPTIWNRDRVERLFGFHYRIEIYVPEAKREYGYYVLPFLNGDRLVARVDLRSKRKAGALEVKGAWAEDGITDDDMEALGAELRRLADFIGLDSVRLGRRGDLMPGLRATQV